MNLSDIFKFTQGLGQKGHQIGRKVGDAIELLTLGIINLNSNLTKHLIIENGVEGATTAKHKVEFSFYNLENEKPSKKAEDLFGLIECKKVGVEQTVKQNFKTWKSQPENKKDFFETNGYSFTISPSNKNYKWKILVTPSDVQGNNLLVQTSKIESEEEDIEANFTFNCNNNSQILIAVDVNYDLHILGPNQILSEIEISLNKCVIIQTISTKQGKVSRINVNESLPGPQTPEKAKQASFVSLDVRKRVLGRFDKTDDKSFISILVIGEASHWEDKSRAMIRLCNDYNLIIPDKILVYLFSKFEEKFGENYQDKITKTKYKELEVVRILVFEIIERFNNKILIDMDTNKFVTFKYSTLNNLNRLLVVEKD